MQLNLPELTLPGLIMHHLQVMLHEVLSGEIPNRQHALTFENISKMCRWYLAGVSKDLKSH